MIQNPLWPEQNPLWPRGYTPKDPRQLEFDFTPPLTQQLDLDLDFEPCRKYENRLTTVPATGMLAISNGSTGVNWVAQNSTMCIDTENLTVLVKKKPNLFKRLLLEALNMKWKLK